MILAVTIAFATLYEQAVARALERQFHTERLSYLAMSIASGEVFAARWDGPESAVPFGSLVKPFLATMAGPGTEFTCNPGRCWLPKGHGRLGIRQALAESCNAWFLAFATSVSHAAISETASRFGLPPPPEERKAWVGLEPWPIRPVVLLGAFARLAHGPGASDVREGMALAAKSGTAKLAGADALMKTGTAPCTHADEAPGDGFALALFPGRDPAFVILVRVHGTTGANAASTAGRILKAFRAPR